MATVPIARPQSTSTDTGWRASWLARHPLVAYFSLAYAVSWAIWLPYYFSQSGLGLLPFKLPQILGVFGQYGPTVAAFILAAATGGRPAMRELLRRYRQWRVNPGWYLLVIVGPLLLLALAVVARVGVGPLGALGQDGPSILLEYLIFVVALKLVLGGALGEEAGWRGFALPRLQARYGALGGSLILGALWAVWHAPHYLSPDRIATQPLPLFAMGVVALAVVYTWVYNRTGGSLLIAILLHSAINSALPIVRDLVPDMAPVEFFTLIMAGYVVVALVLLAATRGRLGYRPAPAAPSGEAAGAGAPAPAAGRG